MSGTTSPSESNYQMAKTSHRVKQDVYLSHTFSLSFECTSFPTKFSTLLYSASRNSATTAALPPFPRTMSTSQKMAIPYSIVRKIHRSPCGTSIYQPAKTHQQDQLYYGATPTKHLPSSSTRLSVAQSYPPSSQRYERVSLSHTRD